MSLPNPLYIRFLPYVTPPFFAESHDALLFYYTYLMVAFSIVIPCYPPHFKFLDGIIEQINRFNITSEFSIKEIIVAASQATSIDIHAVSKYPILHHVTIER